MDFRRLGDAEMDVPVVVFGAWAIGGWWWGGTDDDLAVEAIQAGIEAGVTAIDTAPIYGCGHSERVVGAAVRDRRHEVLLMTKVGLRWDDPRGAHFFDTTHSGTGEPVSVMRNLRPDSIKREVEQSCERLGVDTLDLVQCHWPDPSTPVEESMSALADLVDAGTVGAIGVSNFDVALLTRAKAELARRGHVLASHQPRYSLLDRSIEAQVLSWTRREGVATLAYSPLAQGLLTGKMGPDRQLAEGDGRADLPLFSQDSRRAIAAANHRAGELARAHDCTLAQLALAWCLHQPGVTAVLAGARTAAQIVENAGAAKVSLTHQECAMLAELFAPYQSAD